MSNFFTPEALYQLLPAIHRLRDADEGDALKILLSVIAEEVDKVEDDIAQMYDNWFIETCAEWVVPYIGDLLGVQGLHQIAEGRFSQRARVANTLGYRRRKGTATMLEQLARDTTLWNARAVEFFQLLGTTQYLNGLRLQNFRTPDFRDVNTLDLLNTPFDTIAHTVDVRRIGSNRGWYNILNIGIFLWRLESYGLFKTTPQIAGMISEGRYRFTSLGYDSALYNLPRTEDTITHLAEETNVPAPIRPLAFYRDLQAYQADYALNGPSDQNRNSTYYGPDRSLCLFRDDGSGEVEVPPIDIVCMNLRKWSRPPSTVLALIGGAVTLPLTAALSATTPAVDVTIGAEGPYTAVLEALPTTVEEAAALLQVAIRNADSSPQFTGAQVGVLDGVLVIIAGVAGETASIAATAGDATTAGELGLLALTSTPAVLSSKLDPFPALTIGKTVDSPALTVTLGSEVPYLAILAALPETLSDARAEVETAIRSNAAVPTYANAQVGIVGSRLLIVPGVTGDTIRIAATDYDYATVHQLGLSSKVAVDVERGRIQFALGDEPQSVRVAYHYGFSGDVGGGPYDRRPADGATADTLSNPNLLGTLIQVPDDFTQLQTAISAWTSERAVIQVSDSDTYPENLTINLSGELVIQAANGDTSAVQSVRPTLIGSITINASGDKARVTLDGFLIAGSIQVNGPLNALTIRHCTLVPGQTLDVTGAPQQPNQASITVDPASTALRLTLDHSLIGPLQLPTDMVEVVIADSIVQAPAYGVMPVLASGSLSTFPTLSAAEPTLSVRIGGEGPFIAVLDSVPTTLAAARDALQAAIRSAHDTPAFTEARVISAENRLIVVPGAPGTVRITHNGSDLTAAELRLEANEANEVRAVLGGELPSTTTFAAASPKLTVVVNNTRRVASISGSPGTRAQVRDALQTAIRAAGAAPGFTGAIVALLDNRLLALPGVNGASILFDITSADATTLTDVALETRLPALAGSRTGEVPGPPATIERSTMMGMVHVREMTLASETIFTEMLTADRRQVGCVRFSFVPDGSQTPRRFQCQPETEIGRQIEDAEAQTGGPLTAAQRDALTSAVLGWLVPSFTSTRYGEAAYGQLAIGCPDQIKTGAEDGSEMGVFSFLKQPQRETNLRSSLEEYLRFGLEAGLFYVT